MSVSQNKKNEQQNNLCTTLTEQWKKGELEKGYYYVKGIKKYDGINVYWIGYPIHETERRWIEEVLAPVPSYDHFVELTEKVKENQQLKELLKEAKDIIEWYKADCGYKDTPTEAILTKIDNTIGEKK